MVEQQLQHPAPRARTNVPAASTRTRRLPLPGPGPWISVAFLLLLVAFWQVGAWLEWFNPRLFASPSRVVQAGVDMYEGGTLGRDMASTFTSLAIATGLAMVVGELLGLLLGRSTRLRWMFEWLLVVLNSMPRLAFIPVVLVAVGIGMTSKIVIGFLSAVVPIALFVTTGVRQIPPTLVQVADSLGLSGARLWAKILVPASLPHLAGGLRLGFSRGLIGVVVTEMANPIIGLGRWIALGRTALDPSRLIFAGLMIGLVGTVVVQLIAYTQRRLVK